MGAHRTKSKNFSVRLSDSTIKAIERKADEMGISKNAAFEILVNKGAEFFNAPKLKYYIVLADRFIVIFDGEINRQVLVTLDAKAKNLYCDFDLTDNCRHTEFAKKIPFVHDALF